MSDLSRGVAYPLFQRVQWEMAMKGWTATRLRRDSGVARSTIAKWATQPRPPLASTVILVADALGIDRETAIRLAGILGDTLSAPVAEAPEISDDERRAVLRRSGPAGSSEQQRTA